MKITVNRQLKAGIYYVGFKVGDFTDEERQKMERFGVPLIDLMYGMPGTHQKYPQGITAISETTNPGFSSEEQAKSYEGGVLAQVREKMASLRAKKDDF